MKAIEIPAEVYEEDYEDYLNGVFGDIDVCGFSYPAGQLLKKFDPTAFSCGMADYESECEPSWQCSECDTIYDDEDEANECCQPEEE